MSTVALVLAALLGFVCIVVVAWPYLRSHERDDGLDALDAAEAEQLALLEARDRAIAALQELEIDHREGKITDADYRVLVNQLRSEAAASIATIDAARAEPPSEPAKPDGPASQDTGDS